MIEAFYLPTRQFANQRPTCALLGKPFDGGVAEFKIKRRSTKILFDFKTMQKLSILKLFIECHK